MKDYIKLMLPNDTYIEINGDHKIIKQVLGMLDGKALKVKLESPIDELSGWQLEQKGSE